MGKIARLNDALRLILNMDKGFEGNKKEQLFKNIELSRQVESIGVEPTTSCMPCKDTIP